MKKAILLLTALPLLVSVFIIIGSKICSSKVNAEQEIFVKRVSLFTTQTSIDTFKMDSDIWGFKLELAMPITGNDGKVVTEIIASNMIFGGKLFFAATHPDRVYRMRISDLYTKDDGKHYQTSNPIVIR